MSQPKTYEAATIEEALRAVTIDLGDDVEILEATKERRGGVLGFFARECYVVIARRKGEMQANEPAKAFGDMLEEMASSVADTWESSAAESPMERPQLPVQDAELPQQSVTAGSGGNPTPAVSVFSQASATTSSAPSPTQAGVIDLRTGRRRPAPMVPLIRASVDDPEPAVERPIRPSHLRRRLLGGGLEDRAEQYVMEVDGPMIDLRDSIPRWSLARLEMLDLPDSVLEAVEVLDPTRDLEWVQSLSLAIGKLKPEKGTELTYVVGHGRRSAPELVRGIPRGRIPTALIIDGVRVKVTPDELALSIRTCIR